MSRARAAAPRPRDALRGRTIACPQALGCRTRTRAPSACGQRNLRLLSLSAISPPHVNLTYLSTLPERKRLVVHQTPVTGENIPRSVTWRGGKVVRLQRLHAVKRGVAAASEGQPGAGVNRPRHPLDRRRPGPSGDERTAGADTLGRSHQRSPRGNVSRSTNTVLSTEMSAFGGAGGLGDGLRCG